MGLTRSKYRLYGEGLVLKGRCLMRPWCEGPTLMGEMIQE